MTDRDLEFRRRAHEEHDGITTAPLALRLAVLALCACLSGTVVYAVVRGLAAAL